MKHLIICLLIIKNEYTVYTSDTFRQWPLVTSNKLSRDNEAEDIRRTSP